LVEFKFYNTISEENDILFIGYLLQEESAEIQVDYNHIVSINASDSLGTLKDLKFNESANKYGFLKSSSVSLFASDTYGEFTFPEIVLIIPEDTTNYNILPGTSMTILLHTGLNGNYTVKSYAYYTTFSVIYLEETITSESLDDCSIFYYSPSLLNGIFTLDQILRICYLSTGFNLDANVLTNLKPNGGLFYDLIRSTKINILAFSKGEEWDSCYEVINKIMLRFNATTFQAEGQWWIIRWNENYLYDDISDFDGDKFDFNFSQKESISFNRDFNIDPLSNQIQNGLLKNIIRPISYIKDIYNYGDLVKPIYNSDFEIVGNQIPSFFDYKFGQAYNVIKNSANSIRITNDSGDIPNYASKFFKPSPGDKFGVVLNPPATTELTVDSVTFNGDSTFMYVNTIEAIPDFTAGDRPFYFQTNYDYVSTGWNDNSSTGFSRPVNDRHIRIVKDYEGNVEIDRYIVLFGSVELNSYGLPFPEPRNTESEPIIVSKNDTLIYSFSAASRYYIATQTFVRCRMELRTFDGRVFTLVQSGQWVTGTSGFYDLTNYWNISEKIDCREWIDFEIKTQPLPSDGELYIYLGDYGTIVGDLGPGETYFKNLNLEIKNGSSNYSKNLSGQSHSWIQKNLSLKNNLERDIEMDDAPAGSISGCLFVNDGQPATKTKLWYIKEDDIKVSLGNIITKEIIAQQFKPRISFEGVFLKIVISNDLFKYFISPNSLVIKSDETGKRFITNSLSVNYRNDSAQVSIDEIYNTSTDTDIINELIDDDNLYYEFKYLYNKK
jgi:hypothetical protein